MNKKVKIACAVLLCASAFVLFLTLTREYISLESITFYRTTLRAYTVAYPLLSRTVYGLAYFILVVSFLPVGAILNLLGGFLFGTIQGVMLTNIAATTGALLNLLTIRYLIGKPLHKKYGSQLKKFNTAFKKNGISYLLFVRLAAIFPFPIINTLIGLTNIRISTYLWTTSLGILPGSSLLVFMGKQLGTINSLGEIFTWPVLGAFLLLACLALVPVFVRTHEVA